MDLTLVRNATLLLDLGGARLLVDPMLDLGGARPPIPNTPEPRPNPLADLPRRAGGGRFAEGDPIIMDAGGVVETARDDHPARRSSWSTSRRSTTAS